MSRPTFRLRTTATAIVVALAATACSPGSSPTSTDIISGSSQDTAAGIEQPASAPAPRTPPASEPLDVPTTVPAAAAPVVPADQLDLRASIDETAELTSYKITSSQETGTLTVLATTVWVAGDSHSRQLFNGRESESMHVDGRVYDVEEGVWHLKPITARSQDSGDALDTLLSGLLELPHGEVERTESTATYALLCEPADKENVDPALAVFCTDTAATTATIDLESSLLTTLRTEGSIETWPGQFQEGYVEIRIEPVDPREKLVAPETFDSFRYECFVEALGIEDYDEMAVRLDDNTTQENNDIYSQCGFAFFPRGKDLTD